MKTVGEAHFALLSASFDGLDLVSLSDSLDELDLVSLSDSLDGLDLQNSQLQWPPS